ncbi:hypothetical protein HK097_007407 [Rhizophlyctis rosea]|uniref:DnaJ homologue subfamily C member 28 conserved domain-containing protein n=1 Tax=Rhizophlyctis rosea TaxID=64517 RepID=A0AAD5SLS1_9FUNG|nr:hypothetical protein HK097_007407 [Rhizophlyctis rosea]
MPPATNLTGWEALIERQIRLAQNRGVFDNLSNKGKPLPPPTNAPVGVDNLEFQVSKVLAAQGYAPPWAELRRTIEDDIKRLREESGKGIAALELEQSVKAINGKIQNFNIMAPNAMLRMGEVTVGQFQSHK